MEDEKEPQKVNEEPLTQNDAQPGQVLNQQVDSEGGEREFQPMQTIIGGHRPSRTGRILKRLFFWLLIIGLILGGAYFALQLSKQDTNTPSQAANTKKEIAKVVYAVPEGPLNTLYPNIGPVNIPMEVSLQIFEGLTAFENKTKIVPLLAESWTNPSETVWEFKLKKDVNFHSGRTMTAKDVKYTIDLVKSDEAYSGIGEVFAATITSVEMVDDNTVKIVTEKPDANLLTKLVFIGILDSEGMVGDAESGTGPYIVKSDTTPTEDNIVLSAVDNYHGGTVYTKEVEYKVYVPDPEKGQEAALTDLKDKKLNVIELSEDATIAKAEEEKLELYRSNGQAVANIGFNVLKNGSPLQKLAFRQAILYGVDIETLIKNTKRENTAIPTEQFVTQDIPGYNNTLNRPARDINKAKDYLKQAGYPNGTDFDLTISSSTGTVADEIKRQLAEVGITVNVVIEDNDDEFFNTLFDGEYESWYSSYSSDTLDASDVFTNNFQSPWYSNDTVNTLLDEANSTLNQETRLAKLQEISKVLFEDVAWLPLYVNQSTWVLDKPYVMNSDIPNSHLGVYFWKVYQK